MADFTSSGWSLFIAAVTAIGIVFCVWITMSLSKHKVRGGTTTETTGHVWDDDLQEFDNPLPRWWVYLFYITIVFAVVYLALYPGFGAHRGTLGWSSTGQYDDEVRKVNADVAPLFSKYQSMDLKAVAADPAARAMGERMYLTYCVQCHGSDARGSRGFPNLADRDWLGGDGSPEYIVKTILEGRQGMMPSMAAAVGGAADIENLSHYVLSLSGSTSDAVKAALGKEKFATCAGCHGADGKGMAAVGAPNLTDKVWLYGGSLAAVTESIVKGRAGMMPAFGDLIGQDKARVLAAYVWSLSNGAEQKVAQQ